MSSLVFSPVIALPWVFCWALVLGGCALWNAWRLGIGLPPWQRGCLLTLRGAGLVLVLLIFLQPSRLRKEFPPTIDKAVYIAVDQSRSMDHHDDGGESRMATVQRMLREASLVPPPNGDGGPTLRMFGFSEGAEPMSIDDPDWRVDGPTTRIHDAVTSMLNAAGKGQAAQAIVLLTDGHDFQLVNPARTGHLARMHRVPLFAVPVGSTGQVKDAAVQITEIPAYCYVKQEARIQASIRLIGCAFTELEVHLLRQGEILEKKWVDTDVAQQVQVHFDIREPTTGQFEYEVRVVPMQDETEVQNNSAISYLNVIDQRVKVLMLEASPYWDTTFLQRSLHANQKFHLHSFIKYTDRKVRRLSNRPEESEPVLPSDQEGFNQYDVIVLGRRLETLLDASARDLLDPFVREHGGTIIFSRGPAWDAGADASALEPVEWGDRMPAGQQPLVASREGRHLAPFKLLADAEEAPGMLGRHEVAGTKTLATSLAGLEAPREEQPLAGIVQRRVGRGQVLSIGVEGLWRWALHAGVEEADRLFDRFWDQLILWMLADRDVVTGSGYVLRAHSANILLGDRVRFRLIGGDPAADSTPVPVVVYTDDREVARMTLQSDRSGKNFSGDWLPEQAGRHRAVATFPDGSSGESRFLVYEENEEIIDVATDMLYLQRLCESSGGRLLEPGDLGETISRMQVGAHDAEPRIVRESLWDRVKVFYVICILVGLEWFLRRRWGLC